MSNATTNHFKIGTTDTVYIHSGRFHADDMMFAAMAEIVIKRSGKTPQIIRSNDVEAVRGENIIIGDIGRGIYDHHMEEGNESLGAQNNTENYIAAACGLLYKDIHNFLFKENTETKAVFEAFLDIIEHCDNTADNNTFSDAINFFTPTTNNDLIEDRAELAIRFCRDIVIGFIDAHNKEKSGKIWAIPKVNKSMYPGDPERAAERYYKSIRSIKKKYQYISFNNTQPIKLNSMDVYSVAMSVLPFEKRKRWSKTIQDMDIETISEVERLEKIEWPEAVKNMKHRVLYVSNYIPWTKNIKNVNAIFVIQESLRGGYSVTPVKTAIGTYRCSPNIIINATGCTYVANESRFLLFDTKDNAFEAAETAGKMIDDYLGKEGIQGYRKIYGGKEEQPENNDFQNIICEDLAIKAYVRDKVSDPQNISDDELNDLKECAKINSLLNHVICAHISYQDGKSIWNEDLNTIKAYKENNNELLSFVIEENQEEEKISTED